MKPFHTTPGFLGKREFKIAGTVRDVKLYEHTFLFFFRRSRREIDIELDREQLEKCRREHEIRSMDGSLTALPDDVSVREPDSHPHCLVKGTRVIVTFAYATPEEQFHHNLLPLGVSRLEIADIAPNAPEQFHFDKECGLGMRFV